MNAKIIDLKNYRSTVRNEKNKVAFPLLYRVTGKCWNFVEEAGEVVDAKPSDEPAGPYYTLSEDYNLKLADEKHEMITKLDPAIDSGWVIIRHHMREEYIEGYLDAHTDYGSPELRELTHGAMIFRTKEGLFSVARRPANKGRPDHLIVYITKVADSGIPELGVPAGWIDSVQIVHPDGTVTSNQDLLFEDVDDPDY